MKIVLIAGASGYAGRYLVESFARKGYKVKALIRRHTLPSSFPEGVEPVVGEVTKPESLKGIMNGVDIVVSAVGITRQKDGVTYKDVDYQGNVNLLLEAEKSGVKRFGFIHVVHGEALAKKSVAIAAKQDFVDRLQQSSVPSTVVCPTGFFSDMQDFLDMAKGGRVFLFGDGHFRLNPIHGDDLAEVVVDAIEKGRGTLNVGGPDTFTHKQLAEMALEVSNKPIRITFMWDFIRRLILTTLPWVSPISIYGPAQFFLEAMAIDCLGETQGKHHLRDFWTSQKNEVET